MSKCLTFCNIHIYFTVKLSVIQTADFCVCTRNLSKMTKKKWKYSKIIANLIVAENTFNILNLNLFPPSSTVSFWTTCSLIVSKKVSRNKMLQMKALTHIRFISKRKNSSLPNRHHNKPTFVVFTIEDIRKTKSIWSFMPSGFYFKLLKHN